MQRRNDKVEQNVFNMMIAKAITTEEKEGFEKMTRMILTVRKYERLRRLYNM